MGTRSSIAVKLPGGKVKAVYCHWDGYLEWVGSKLANHYNSQELAEKLISGGSISSLGATCDLVEGHTFEKPADNVTVYYGRDRGEKGQEPKQYEGVTDWLKRADSYGAEFMYIFVNDEWYVSETHWSDKINGFEAGDLLPLTAELDKVVA